MVNEHKIIGNLGADPEVRNLDGGGKVASFNVATSENWKDKDGKKQERTEWHRVVAWRGLAEVVEQYLKKGMQVYVSGPSRTRTYEDQEKRKLYITEVEAREIKMLGGKREGGPPPPGEDDQPN